MKKNNFKAGEEGMLFGKENYRWMLVGFVLIALGFILMSGEGNTNPEVFNEDIFSFRRIRLAPALVILGYLVEVYAILGPWKKNKE